MFNGYLLMILLIIVIALFRNKRDTSLGYVIIACAILIVFMGLRDVSSIGVDSRVNYANQYAAINYKTFSQMIGGDWRNIGLSLFMKFVSSVLHLDYQGFVLIETIFTYIVFGRMIYKYSPSPMQSIVCHCGLLYFFLFMDAMKQCMAMAFLCLAFDCIIQKKPIRYLLFIALGAWFHLPSVIFLPAYIIANQKSIRYYVLELLSLFIVVYVFRGFFLNLMVDAYGSVIDGSGRFLMNKVIIMIIVIISALVLRPPSDDDRVYVILLRLIGVAAVLQTFSGYSNNFERLADYYFQFSVIFIPMVFEQKETNSKLGTPETVYQTRGIIKLVSCMFFVFRFASTAGSLWYYTPFKFFWA